MTPSPQDPPDRDRSDHDSSDLDGAEPTREVPLYHRGSASVDAPVTAIPYSEPTLTIAPPRRRWGMLLLTVFAIGLIIVAGGVLTGYLLFGSGPGVPPTVAQPSPSVVPSPTPTIDPPRVVTERFLAAVLDGNQVVIQDQLCGLLKNNGSTDNSGGLGLGLVVGYQVGAEDVRALSATVGVELRVPLLGPIKFDVYLIKETAGWRVCGGVPA